MSGAGLPAQELIALAVEAISDSDPARLRPLLAPEVEVVTGRAIHRGPDAAATWSQKRYEHLDRRYVIDHVEPSGRGWLVSARVQYVWRESGEIGDSSPAFLAFEVDDSRITALSLHDERPQALDALGA